MILHPSTQNGAYLTLPLWTFRAGGNIYPSSRDKHSASFVKGCPHYKPSMASAGLNPSYTRVIMALCLVCSRFQWLTTGCPWSLVSFVAPEGQKAHLKTLMLNGGVLMMDSASFGRNLWSSNCDGCLRVNFGFVCCSFRGFCGVCGCLILFVCEDGWRKLFGCVSSYFLLL